MLRSGRFRLIFAFSLLFTVLAPDALRSTLSWWGYGAVTGILLIVSIAVLWTERDRWSLRDLPIPLVLFLLLVVLSTVWSNYRVETILASGTTWATVTAAVALVVTVSWEDLLRYLGYVLRTILGLSLLFELCVELFVGSPVLPPWTAAPTGGDELPVQAYWSLSQLFDGGRIQGIVGNANLLAFLGLLAVIVFGVQLADKRVRPLAGWLSMSAAIAVLLLTRSATVLAALAAVGVLAFAVRLMRRATTSDAVAEAYVLGSATAIGGIGLTILLHAPILDALDRTSTLTGRVTTWEAVIGLASERPLVGWGWISHWTPWVEPLGTLVEVDGFYQLQAHNAWLDVWLQLGVLGLVVFGALILVTIVRTWWLATDRRKLRLGADEPFIALTVFPLLALAALLVQSLSESRLLVEGGLLLLTVLAVKLKRHELG